MISKNNLLSKPKIIFLVAIIVSGASCVFYFKSKGVVSIEQVEVDKKYPITAAMVEAKTIRNSFTTQTYLLPWKEVLLKPSPQSLVREVNVKVGDLVKKGMIIASLDSEVQKLKNELEKIDIEMKNIDLGVTRALAKKSFLSKNEFRQKELEHQANTIRMKMNQIDSGSSIKSPIDGRISEITIKEGDYIDQNNQNAYIKIIDDSKLRAQIYLPSEVSSVLNTNGSVIVEKTNNSTNVKEQATAFIAALSPTIDLKTGTVYSEVYLNSYPKTWRPGVYVQVQFIISEAENIISIPKEAIVYENSQPFVYVVRTQERTPASKESFEYVKKVSIKLGISDKSIIEVSEGLEELDQIVVQGQGAVSDGAKVEVLE